MLTNEDFPTLDRPIKANSGNDSAGQESKSGELQSNTAEVIFTMTNLSLIHHKKQADKETLFTHFCKPAY